jgi:hypothetical protein
MAHCISLKQASKQIIGPIPLREMVQSNLKTVFLPYWDHLGTLKWTQKGKQRPTSGRDVWSVCLSLEMSPNQIIKPILLKEIVQNNQKTGFFKAVFCYLGAI